jgi:hypothetical protein
VAGKVNKLRSSSGSRHNWGDADHLRENHWPRALGARMERNLRDRNREVSDMVRSLLAKIGLRRNVIATRPDLQTKRRGEAVSITFLLCGRTSPAAVDSVADDREPAGVAVPHPKAARSIRPSPE